MNRFHLLPAMMLCGLILTGGLQAAPVIINEYSHDNDGAVYGSGNFPVHDLIVGGATGANYAGIAFFELPDRGPGYIKNAELTLTVVSSGTMPSANADLYVLGYVSDPPTMASGWLLISDTETRDGDTLGTGLGSDTPLKLVDDIVTAGTAMSVSATTQTDAAQSQTLAQYLNTLYDTYGAAAGDYVVIRINPDADQFNTEGASSNFRYGGSHRGTDASLLTLTIVPEPASMSMLALGALVTLRRRR